MRTAACDAYADLLTYPSEGFAERFVAARDALGAEEGVDGRNRLAGLAAVLEAGCSALEEVYTRTFDLNPACALETGWHLYGEDYDRGAFLVRIRALLRDHGVEESGELPDHVTHVLRLLPRLEDGAAGDLARRQVLPSLARMLTALTDEANPYRPVLVGSAALLERTWGPAEAAPASAFACPPPYDGAPDTLCPGPVPPPTS